MSTVSEDAESTSGAAADGPDELCDGRFELVDRLGSGGQGTSWRADDTETGRDVVVKCLDVETVDQWKSVELFERSVQVLQDLDHAKVPDYIDAFEREVGEEGRMQMYLVREFAPGRSLRETVDDGTRFTEQEVRDIARELLEILDYLHDREPPVIHRDIKPANIVRGPDGELALVDFGAVQASVMDATGGSTVVGTAGYVPPEQLTGEATVQSDLYAVGTTLVHLLTHLAPSELPVERMHIQFRQRTGVSEPFADWLDGLLAPDPEDRHASAREALERLDAPSPSSPAPAESDSELDDYPTLDEGPPEHAGVDLDVANPEIVVSTPNRSRFTNWWPRWPSGGWFAFVLFGLSAHVGLAAAAFYVPAVAAAFGFPVVVSCAALFLQATRQENPGFRIEVDGETFRVESVTNEWGYAETFHTSVDEMSGLVELPVTDGGKNSPPKVARVARPGDNRAGRRYLLMVPPEDADLESEQSVSAGTYLQDLPFVFDGPAGAALDLGTRRWIIDAVDEAIERQNRPTGDD